jgi:CBS domain containing-hemolysin-like protein
MTPRTAVVGLAVEATLAEAADTVAGAGRSRYPVYRETLDDIVGTVHAKAVLAGLRAQPVATVESVMRPTFFVPGTREVEDVLADMKRQKVHMAIVLDEYGGTAGLVTMEDLLEEIVGPIYDEYDRGPEPAAGVPDAAPVLAGSMEIREVNETHSLALDDTDYATVGGLVFGMLGRLPKVGDLVKVTGGQLEVVEMDGRRVGKVRLVRSVAQPSETRGVPRRQG